MMALFRFVALVTAVVAVVALVPFVLAGGALTFLVWRLAHKPGT